MITLVTLPLTTLWWLWWHWPGENLQIQANCRAESRATHSCTIRSGELEAFKEIASTFKHKHKHLLFKQNMKDFLSKGAWDGDQEEAIDEREARYDVLLSPPKPGSLKVETRPTRWCTTRPWTGLTSPSWEMFTKRGSWEGSKSSRRCPSRSRWSPLCSCSCL